MNARRGDLQAKHNLTWTITSLLSILLMTFHFSDDVVRGFEPGGFKNVRGMLIRYIIILLGSLLGCLVSIAHMRGAGLVGGRIANSSGSFFWVWTLIALGVTATVSVILSARGLWSLQWGKSPSSRS